jgi:hypothetical protein
MLYLYDFNFGWKWLPLYGITDDVEQSDWAALLAAAGTTCV